MNLAPNHEAAAFKPDPKPAFRASTSTRSRIGKSESGHRRSELYLEGLGLLALAVLAALAGVFRSRSPREEAEMSAEQNIASIKACYRAFDASDITAAMKDVADDVEWTVPGESTLSGTYRGKDEVVECLMQLAEKSYTSVPEHFLGDDDRVVVLAHTTSDGKPSDQVDVYTFHKGKVARFYCVLDTLLQQQVWGSK
jgi:ketosteroid isomerase-like protein